MPFGPLWKPLRLPTHFGTQKHIRRRLCLLSANLLNCWAVTHATKHFSAVRVSVESKHMPNIHMAHFFARSMMAKMTQSGQFPFAVYVCVSSVDITGCVYFKRHTVDSMFDVVFMFVGMRLIHPMKVLASVRCCGRTKRKSNRKCAFRILSTSKFTFFVAFSSSSTLSAFCGTACTVFFRSPLCGHDQRVQDFERRKFTWNNFQVIKLQLNFRRWNANVHKYEKQYTHTMERYGRVGAMHCLHFEMSFGFGQIRCNKWFAIR